MMTRFKPHEFKELRRECGTWSAWTPRQLADIASGFDPRVGHANTEFYNGVLGAIMVAVRVPDSTIPIIDNVRWPEIAEEIVYRNWPLLRPAGAYAWAQRRWPKTIIHFAAGDFVEEPSGGPVQIKLPHLPREIVALFDVMRSLAQEKLYPPQRTVALEIGEKLNLKPDPSGEPNRVAQKLARMIRPDALADQDQRATRKRST